MTTAPASPPPVAFPPQPADQALLQRLFDEEHVARWASDPEWSDYLVVLARALLDALPDALAPARDAIARLGFPMDTAAIVLIALLAAAIAAVAVIAVVRLVRRRRPPELPPDEATERLQPAPRDREAWRALLDQRLSAGGIAEALEAVWWWLAASVSRGPVDPAWTSRELLDRAGRPDLRPWAATLDRMVYGARRPAAEDVRGLVQGLESAV